MSGLGACLVGALFAAAASIVSEYRGLERQKYLFKPLPVLLMIPVVLSAPVEFNTKLWFIVALIASAVGDVLLIESQRFLIGLVAFLLAHLAYIFGISSVLEATPRLWLILPLTAWGGVLFFVLRPHLKELALPVLGYITIITVMVWLALELHFNVRSQGSSFIALGAIAFALSDTTLALDHFRKPFAVAKLTVLGSYFLAQISLAFGLLFIGTYLL